MVAAGIESNFERDGVEYRLGAEPHAADDYLGMMADSGFGSLERHDFAGDSELLHQVPSALKYLGRPLLLVLVGRRGL
jgi:hypothetical protein